MCRAPVRSWTSSIKAPSSRSRGSRRTIVYPPITSTPRALILAIHTLHEGAVCRVAPVVIDYWSDRVFAVYERGAHRCGDRMEAELEFTSAELDFLRTQRIGRLATVGPSGWPHVVPVMYSFDESGAFEFDVDGVKLRNLTAEPRAAMVVDAMGPKRGVAVQGRAELIGPERARLAGVRKFSWGL
ncbi:MAG: hypothetical protein E6I58_09470 [Chloroflexi bacterium]|nr:MAG: hypothetical protein E6J05_09910 [Chloroflexota bacterium]TME55871.1 MAG: hypothetical protein E6I58_09470 [Chloroflexota bacterium]